MNTYDATQNLFELFEKKPEFEEVLIEVMKIQGWSSKEARLQQIYKTVREKSHNYTKLQLAKMLMNNYDYSKSQAYKIIKKAMQSTFIE